VVITVIAEILSLDKRPVVYIIISASLFGLGSPLAKLLLGDISPVMQAGLLYLGAFSYGISQVFFIKAFSGLGSSRTGAFFNLGPLVGAAASIRVMFPAMLLMGLGLWLIGTERHEHAHYHQGITHAHRHRHDDIHHLHKHPAGTSDPHSHEHTHAELRHTHAHWPDIQHRHQHQLFIKSINGLKN
jgi:hypothetical protein